MGLSPADNIVLIGMPGVGKSVCGVLLAKAARRGFVDTDLVIQQAEGRPLPAIIAERGLEGFCQIEQRHILALGDRGCVIATGGSAVYSPVAMEHLSDGGVIVHLVLPLAELAERLGDPVARGVVMTPGMTIAQLYERRMPLYRRWAQHTIDCHARTPDEVVAAILTAV